MKNIVCFLLVGLGAVLSSCDTGDETSNQVAGNLDTIGTSDDSFNTYSEDFKELIKTSTGVFRGIDLGSMASEVKKLEDTSSVEESQGYIDYTINYGEFENADIRYSLSEGKVVAIEIDIYPKSKDFQTSIFTEFESYFTTKYGMPLLPEPNSRKWENTEKDLYIKMEKKDTQKVHDIHITITSLTRQTASNPQQTLPANP